jgi:formylglycine-generating enzyme required for sulfatase activity
MARDKYEPGNLSAFYIDKYEVTNARYKVCVEDGHCLPISQASAVMPSSPYSSKDFADYPVIGVTRPKAEAFCRWAGKRLPTEAEWEKAARGGDGRMYPWGNEPPDCSRLNYLECRKYLTKVGSYPSGASPYGAMDMAGNVWEWMSDWYGAEYYAAVYLRQRVLREQRRLPLRCFTVTGGP